MYMNIYYFKIDSFFDSTYHINISMLELYLEYISKLHLLFTGVQNVCVEELFHQYIIWI
jgi:hypothetical protein